MPTSQIIIIIIICITITALVMACLAFVKNQKNSQLQSGIDSMNAIPIEHRPAARKALAEKVNVGDSGVNCAICGALCFNVGAAIAPAMCAGACKQCGVCIASSQLIETKSNGLIKIKDLKPGDYVKNGDSYDLVFFINEHEGEFEVLNIHLGNDILKLTSQHLVYLDDQMIKASSLNIGDIIQGKTIENITKTIEKVRNPATISGKLLLAGVVVSCYSYSKEHAIKIQKLTDCFDFEKLTEELGSDKVQELVNTMYNKLANETFRKDRIMKPLPQMITV